MGPSQQSAFKRAFMNSGSAKNATNGRVSCKNATQGRASFKKATRGQGSIKNAGRGRSSSKNASRDNSQPKNVQGKNSLKKGDQDIDIKPNARAQVPPRKKSCLWFWLLLILGVLALLLGWWFWRTKSSNQNPVRRAARAIKSRAAALITNSDGSCSLSKTAAALGVLAIPLWYLYKYGQSQGVVPLTCAEGEVLGTAKDGTQGCVEPSFLSTYA